MDGCREVRKTVFKVQITEILSLIKGAGGTCQEILSDQAPFKCLTLLAIILKAKFWFSEWKTVIISSLNDICRTGINFRTFKK